MKMSLMCWTEMFQYSGGERDFCLDFIESLHNNLYDS